MTLECRGHGKSEAGDPEEFSTVTFADDVAAMIEREAVAPAVVGGISMGAAIALRLAVTRPGLARALVLARPAWLTDSAPPNMRPYAEVGELLARFAPDEAQARFESSETAARLKRDAPDNLASLTGFFAREPQAITAALLTRIAADGPGVTRDQLAALRLPVLVIGHTQDEAHPLAYAEALAALIPGARLVTITPKAKSRPHYVADFRLALSRFLVDLAL
jgi:pimeloyl-ACP methyl ester carboxylesterase